MASSSPSKLVNVIAIGREDAARAGMSLPVIHDLMRLPDQVRNSPEPDWSARFG
jgi:hypothetical protein